jgi:hypothetical protein
MHNIAEIVRDTEKERKKLTNLLHISPNAKHITKN